MKSKTYRNEACKIEMAFIDHGDNTYEIKAGRGGECHHVLLEALGKALSGKTHDEVVDILSNYNCEKAVVKHRSCLHDISKLLKEQEGK